MKNLVNIVEKLIHAVEEKQGFNVKFFQVTGHSIVTDYFVLVSAKNQIHCKAIINELQGNICKLFEESNDLFLPPKIAGKTDSGWIIMDLNSIVIHILLDELREHYELDQLYEKIAVSVNY